MSLNFVFCPACVDGRILDPSTKLMRLCPTCEGWATVSPDNICNCGKSCHLEEKGIIYCGRKECLDALLLEARIAPHWVRPSNRNVQEMDFDSEDIWWQTHPHPHRMGPTRFGGGSTRHMFDS
jgi:hypothetical protein